MSSNTHDEMARQYWDTISKVVNVAVGWAVEHSPPERAMALLRDLAGLADIRNNPVPEDRRAAAWAAARADYARLGEDWDAMAATLAGTAQGAVARAALVLAQEDRSEMILAAWLILQAVYVAQTTARTFGYGHPAIDDLSVKIVNMALVTLAPERQP